MFDPACGSGNFLIIAYRELQHAGAADFQRLDEIGGGPTTGGAKRRQALKFLWHRAGGLRRRNRQAITVDRRISDELTVQKSFRQGAQSFPCDMAATSFVATR